MRRAPRRGWVRVVRLVLTGIVALAVVLAVVVAGVLVLAVTAVDRVEVGGLDGRDGAAVLGLVDGERAVVARPPDRGRVDTIVLPLDLIVDVPGIGHATLREAYAEGGPELLVAAVGGYTGIAVGRYVEIDREALRGPAIERGGVDACTSTPGSEAERVVRDAATASGAVAPIARPGTWLNPLRLVPAARAAGAGITLDSDVGVRDLMRLPWGVAEVDAVTVATLPVQSVPGGLRALPEQAEWVFQAFRTGGPLPGAIASMAPEQVDLAGTTVTVLNGAGIGGLAGEAADQLRGRGVTVAEVGNAAEMDRMVTEVRHPVGAEEVAAAFALMFDGVPVLHADDEDERLVVVLGADWAERRTLFEPEPVEEPTTVTVRLVQACA